MALRGLFVTGTDTGVGKTFLTVGIVQQLRAQGIATGAYKPAASGSRKTPEGLVWDDVELLAAAVDHRYPRERVCPQTFTAPLAPPVAARLEGRQADARLLREGALWWQGRVDVLVVEGAGGLLSPISDVDLVADVAGDLGWPLLIVARAGLGTINHTLLTVEAAERRGLAIAGIVLNDADGADDPSKSTNPAELAKHTAVPILAVVHRSSAADLLQQVSFRRMDWNSLCRENGGGVR